MNVTSYEFLLFVTICVVVYYLLPAKFQWVVLLAASMIFYEMAGRWLPALILLMGAVTFVAAKSIEKSLKKQEKVLAEQKENWSREEKKAYKSRENKKRKRMLLLALFAELFILGLFKYLDFAIDNVNWMLSKWGGSGEIGYVDLLLPMGISFYTFQTIGYLLDVYWEKVPAQKNFWRFTLFVSFFPQLIQGPISRYGDLGKHLYEAHRFDSKKLAFGLERVLWGYFKKLVVADTLVTVVSCIASDEYYTGAWVLLEVILYAVQLYADFTGGIDITIGVAQLFGVELKENFDHPYFSKNITEFWRRWHISMGTWFRDYVFYPISISDKMNRLTRGCKKRFGMGVAKRVAVYIATMVTWLATGIWHGASWNFVVWGILNGVVILISGELEPLYKRFHNKFPRMTESVGYGWFQMIRTFFLMGFLRMFDCYTDVGMTFQMFGKMFRDFDFSVFTWEEFEYFGLQPAQYVIVICGTLLMWFVSVIGREKSVREQLLEKPYWMRFCVVTGLLFAVLLFGSYGIGYEETQFIYNQF